MSDLITKKIETPLGVMKLGAYKGALVFALWLTGDRRKADAVERRVAARCGAEAVRPGDCDLFVEAEVQIMEYLKGRRCSFDLPIRLWGTDFQQRVWRGLTDVNYGCVTTYGMLALMLGCSGRKPRRGRCRRRQSASRHHSLPPPRPKVGAPRRLCGRTFGEDSAHCGRSSAHRGQGRADGRAFPAHRRRSPERIALRRNASPGRERRRPS